MRPEVKSLHQTISVCASDRAFQLHESSSAGPPDAYFGVAGGFTATNSTSKIKPAPAGNPPPPLLP